MKETRAAAAQGTKVPPTYFNITESTLELLNPLPPPPHRPDSHPHNHVFSLNTAGSNRLLFSAPTDRDLIRWTTGLRLAAWERSRLEEIYTGHLIRAGRREPRSPLEHGRLEGWARVRVMGAIEWRRLWLVLSDPEASASDTPSQRRRHSLFGIGGNQPDTVQEPNTGVVMASFYNEPRTAKNRTSSLPVLTMTAVTQCYAIFPERLEVISQSNLMKIVGRISGDLVTIEGGLRDSGWALIMPEAPVDDPAPPTTPSPLSSMMRWVTAFHDAFKLYGRPQQYSWDRSDPKSLWFAYPQDEFRGDLFLNIDEASMANHRLNTPGIRALFTNLVHRRMIAASEAEKTPDTEGTEAYYTPPLEAQKSKDAFTLPPLSFNEDNPKSPTPPPVPEPAQTRQVQQPEQQPNFAQQQQPQAQNPHLTVLQQQQDPRALTPISEAEASRQNSTHRPQDQSHAVGQAITTNQAVLPQHQTQQPEYQPVGGEGSAVPITNRSDSSQTFGRNDEGVAGHQETLQPTGDNVESLTTPASQTQTTIWSQESGHTLSATPIHETAPSVSTTGAVAGVGAISGASSPGGFRGGTSPAPPGAEAAQPQARQPTSVSPPGPQVGVTQTRSPPSSFKRSQYGAPVDPQQQQPQLQQYQQQPPQQQSFQQQQPIQQQQQAQPPQSAESGGGHKGALAAGAAAVGAAAFGAAALSSRPSDGSRSGSHHSENIHHPRPTKRISVSSEQPVASLRDEPAAMYLMNMVEEPAPINNSTATAQTQPKVDKARPTIVTQSDQFRPDMQRRPSGARAYPSPAVRSASNGSRSGEVAGAEVRPAAGQSAPAVPTQDFSAPPTQSVQPQPQQPQSQPLRSQHQPQPHSQLSGPAVAAAGAAAAATAAAIAAPAVTSAPVQLPKSNTNHDLADAAAYLAYADNEHSSPEIAKRQPIQAGSPPAARSSFAPSKAATERRAKAETQAAEQQRSMAVPGGGKRQQRSNITSTHEDWSDEEEEEEGTEEVPGTAGSHGQDFSRRGSRALPLPPGQQPPQQQQLQQQQSQQYGQQPQYGQQAYSQPPQQYQQQPQQGRPLPRHEVPTNGHGHDVDHASMQNLSIHGSERPRSRSPPAPHRHLPAQPQQQRRSEPQPPAPPAARQSVWNANFAVDHGMNEPPKGGKFVELEEPSVALTKAFSPGGLLQAGMQDKHDRSAKRQEEVARETGSSLVNVPEKPPPPQTGLMGAVAAHERDRKNPGGIGATLTDRDRDRRIAEERQRKIEELQRQQMEQFGGGGMGQPGSMYGGFPPYQGYMQPPMGYPGGYGMSPQAQQQAMMAAQMAYQQTMMAMSHAGSQAGDDRPASPTGPPGGSPPPFPPFGYMGGFMPSQSMYGFPQYGMPPMPMGQMPPMQGMPGMPPSMPGWASPPLGGGYRGSMHEGYDDKQPDRQAS